MRGGYPSRTAWRVALARAAHQIYDNPRIFTDPLAVRIVGEEGARRLREDPGRHMAPLSRKVRSGIVGRSRFCEDAMAEAADRGVRQFVILGAGLDTFAFRSPLARRVKIFEIDHPVTQRWKRQLLAAAGIPSPPSLTFAPADFEKMTLTEGLAGAGVDLTQPTFFSWLGVIYYLTAEAALTTLRLIGASAAGGSEIVFDYLVAPQMQDAAGRRDFADLSDRVASQAGEPWQTVFEPDRLADELHRFGFEAVEDFDSEALARHFAGRFDEVAAFRMMHLLRAKVA